MRRLAFTAGLVLAASGVPAQVGPVGPPFPINTHTTNLQQLATVACDAGGNFVVAWQSNMQDGSGWGIFGRPFDALAAPRGPEFRANTYTTGMQEFRAAVASDGAGNHTVVWGNLWNSTPPLDYEVMGQRYDTSGNPIGGEFQVNSSTVGWQYQPSIASDPAGNFVVVWHTYDVFGIGLNFLAGQRYAPTGSPVGGEFSVESYGAGIQEFPNVAADGAGGFVVAWSNRATGGHGDGTFVRTFDGVQGFREMQASTCASIAVPRFRPGIASLGPARFVAAWLQTGASGTRVQAQVFGATGTPVTREVEVGSQAGVGEVHVVSDPPDRFVVTWWQGGSISGQAYNKDGIPISAQFLIDPSARFGGAASRQAAGEFVVTWTGYDSDAFGIFGRRFAGLGSELEPTDLRLDTAGNGVLEPGELVAVVPGWRNPTAAPMTATGTMTGFTGPAGATYTIVDGTAQYGPIPGGQRGDCTATGDCYSFTVAAPSRPAQHWDATVNETLSTGTSRAWSLHFGDSFTDVPRTRGFYRFIETLLHHGVTGGCSAGSYCPDSPIARQEMAVFLRVAREGAACAPGACVAGTETFADVPASSTYCRWIEELSRFGVATGCAPGLYCPLAPVTREQMAVFVLATREGPGYAPPACVAGSERFADVPASSGFCRWIEELARRNVVTGCGGALYCPADPVTRGDMSVFVSVTFGLALYGP